MGHNNRIEALYCAANASMVVAFGLIFGACTLGTEGTAGLYPDDVENPDSPDNPDRPDNSDSPDRPDTPDNPNRPSTPDNPDNPDNPDEPVEGVDPIVPPAINDCQAGVTGGTYTATRLNNNQPIITRSMFDALGVSAEGRNINGPSVLYLPPNVVPNGELPAPGHRYLMYFANHDGLYIRAASSDNPVGPWTLFNTGDVETNTPGRGVLDLGPDKLINIGNGVTASRHIASPDAFVDTDNRRIMMCFHGEETLCAFSRYGLNFNMPAEGGEPGRGILPVVFMRSYSRMFMVDNLSMAFANTGDMHHARVPGPPTSNAVLTADPDRPQNAWPRFRNSPIRTMYANKGRPANDPRHFAVHQRAADPNSIFVFWTSKGDAPEQIYLTRFDLEGLNAEQRLDPNQWNPVGQKIILKPEQTWEGAEFPLEPSRGSSANNVNQLRDPYVFTDPIDCKLYLYYAGAGENAIGVASLAFSTQSNTRGPQGDLLR